MTKIRRRIIIFTVGLFIFYAILIVRLFYLQIISHGNFVRLAQRQQICFPPPAPKRGNIYDRNLQLLALSLDTISIYVLPHKITQPNYTATKLASICGIDPGVLIQKIRDKTSFIWITRQADWRQAEKIDRLKVNGVAYFPESKRFYPKGELACHLLGFSGIDYQGLEGVELSFDDYLRPSPDKLPVERDARGRNRVGEEMILSSLGYDLVLTIDERIQHLAEKELEETVDRYQARGGTVIVMDPRNGEIFALANRPVYNPNYYKNYSPLMRRNQAITDVYEPGSTFKVMIAAALLEEKAVSPEDLFYCENGSFLYKGRRLHDTRNLSWLTFRQIIEHSSNIGMLKASLKMEEKELYRYLRKFGFGEKTGISLPGEAVGILRPPEHWSDASIAAIAIGQEVGVTPLQLITAVAAVANGGLLMEPYIVKEICDPKGEIICSFLPRVKRRIISSETSQKLTDILVSTVQNGSGRIAMIEGYTVAGKTGTSQKKIEGEIGYASGKYVSSFVGYLPAENPRLVILVVVDEPRGKYQGAEVASPTFKRIAQGSLYYLNLYPGDRKLVRGKEGPWFSANLSTH